MRKTITAIVAVTAFLQISTSYGNTSLPPGIPDGFPTEGIVSNGDNHFTSNRFGSFQLDTNRENRFIHEVLGPIIWDFDHDTNIITLNSEWWGPLITALDEAKSDLPITFPYVISERTGHTYYVEINGLNETPFFNHGTNESGDLIGWQKGIGIELSDARSYYFAAESQVVAMQQHVQMVKNYYSQLDTAQIASGSTNIETIRQQAIDSFNAMDAAYRIYAFFNHRIGLAPKWVQKQGGSELDIKSAQNWIIVMQNLQETALSTYQDAQTVLYHKIEPKFVEKQHQRAEVEAAERAIEQARLAAEQQAKTQASSSNSGSSSHTTTPKITPTPSGGNTIPVVTAGDAISWSNVNIIGLVAGRKDVKDWPITAKLSNMGFQWGSNYGWTGYYAHLSINGTNNWQTYSPYPGQNRITGNLWIFIPREDGRYDATVFEGYGNYATIYAMGNLNYQHHNILAGTNYAYPWQPKSGQKFGWMVSTNVIYPGSNGQNRSNIIIQAWP